MSPTGRQARDRKVAVKKVEIAIDKLIDVQDLGFGTDAVARALESLNNLLARLNDGMGYTA